MRSYFSGSTTFRRMFLGLMLGFLGLMGACTQIDTGNVGVEHTLGEVKMQELPPGIYQTFTKSVDEYTTKEVAVQVNDLKPKARDNLIMEDVDMDVYFKVSGDKVADLVAKYQGDVYKLPNGDMVPGYGRVMREAREAIFKAFASFDATTLHTKRTELVAEVQKILQTELDRTDKGAFTITNVNSRSLVTDKGLEASIRKRAEFDQQIEAKIKEVELSRKEAERQLVQAQGEAAANNAIAASITPSLLRLREIEATATFAKAGTHTVILPAGGGATPLIGISK